MLEYKDGRLMKAMKGRSEKASWLLCEVQRCDDVLTASDCATGGNKVAQTFSHPPLFCQISLPE